jgi:hypothetical protein
MYILSVNKQLFFVFFLFSSFFWVSVSVHGVQRKCEENAAADPTYRKRKENVGLARGSKSYFWQAKFALAKPIKIELF